jgi:hypothetical protein
MSSSPASTVLATPTYSRSGRERKTVQKYGSMIDSDIITDPEEEVYGYYDPDDEDESFEEARVKESDDEEDDGDYGEEGDDEMMVSGTTIRLRLSTLQCRGRVADMDTVGQVSKPTKVKQSQPKKKVAGTTPRTSSSKSKPPGVLLPKSAKTLAAKKGSSEPPSSTISKASGHRGACPIPCIHHPDSS